MNKVTAIKTAIRESATEVAVVGGGRGAEGGSELDELRGESEGLRVEVGVAVVGGS